MQQPLERCDLCGETLPDLHRHVWDRGERTLHCACRACELLFDHGATGTESFRLVPQDCKALEDFDLDDLGWHALGIPVDVAYFVRRTGSLRVTAFYPSPAGAVESLLPLDAWEAVEQANSAVAAMEPDVRALLVRKNGERREGWIVGIDVCYRLIATLRGATPGTYAAQAMHVRLDRFFDELRERNCV